MIYRTASLLRYFTPALAFAALLLVAATGSGYADKSAAPVFETFTVRPGGGSIIGGRAEARAHVELMNGAKLLAEINADSEGLFQVEIPAFAEPGDYRLVLRSTDKSGGSATSTQTLFVSVPEREEKDILALIDEPGRTRRLISPNKTFEGEPKAVGDDFAVERIAYSMGNLSICGKSPALMRVLVRTHERSIGSERSDEHGDFCINRPYLLEQSDYIIRAELLNDSGDSVAYLRLPFSVNSYSQDNIQRYVGEKWVHLVVVRRGETLSSIAVRLYGDGSYAKTIFEANRQVLTNPNAIIAGQELVLPQGLKDKKD